jgi:protocatechuate 3,4-dioxygenase beta subunit
MQRNRKFQRIDTTLPLPLLDRRAALQSLGVLAFAAVGCGSDNTDAGAASGDQTGAAGVSSPPAAMSGGSSAPSMSSTPAMSNTAAMNSARGGSSATTTTPASSTPATMHSSSAGASGSAGSSGSMASAGSPATASGGAGGAAGAAANGGAGGMNAMGGTSLDSLACIVTPAMEDGPFFVDEKLNRADLVMGETDDNVVKAAPLELVLGVYSVSGMMCKPLAGVQVDIWQANAIGVYSDVTPGLVQSVDTRGKMFLRGYQLTDETGIVRFKTIYPGWYMSRTIHIHFKLRMFGSGTSVQSFTSQMYFDEKLNSEVLAKGPYTNRTGTRQVLNDDDHIYNGTASNGQKPANGKTPPGKDTTVTIVSNGAGYTGTLKIGVMI